MKADSNHYKSELEILEKKVKRHGKKSMASRINEYKVWLFVYIRYKIVLVITDLQLKEIK